MSPQLNWASPEREGRATNGDRAGCWILLALASASRVVLNATPRRHLAIPPSSEHPLEEIIIDDTLIAELLPEWGAFFDAAANRDPGHGTSCAAWTTRDILAHQAGNAVELGRVLAAHLDRRAVPETHGFDERESPFRRISDDDRLAALQRVIADLARVLERGLDEPDTWVPWTGRRMKVAWFGEHMRSELILHRWDLVGDDEQATTHLAQPWMTTHSVDAVGVPLLRRGGADLPDAPFTSRLRVADQPDVILTGGAQPTIRFAPADSDTQPDLITDSAARVLLLWGRQPADTTRLHSNAGPEQLGRTRTLLSGY
ncbi:MAG: maleylpyruvate isomerase N-terminal domain-containing protein [Pseudonocardiaceae bacterium]